MVPLCQGLEVRPHKAWWWCIIPGERTLDPDVRKLAILAAISFFWVAENFPVKFAKKYLIRAQQNGVEVMYMIFYCQINLPFAILPACLRLYNYVLE